MNNENIRVEISSLTDHIFQRAVMNPNAIFRYRSICTRVATALVKRLATTRLLQAAYPYIDSLAKENSLRQRQFYGVEDILRESDIALIRQSKEGEFVIPVTDPALIHRIRLEYNVPVGNLRRSEEGKPEWTIVEIDTRYVRTTDVPLLQLIASQYGYFSTMDRLHVKTINILSDTLVHVVVVDAFIRDMGSRLTKTGAGLVLDFQTTVLKELEHLECEEDELLCLYGIEFQKFSQETVWQCSSIDSLPGLLFFQNIGDFRVLEWQRLVTGKNWNI